MNQQKLAINGARLRQTLEDLSAFGATERRGVTRLALTNEDMNARNYFKEQCEVLGMVVTVDDMGVMYSKLEGKNPDLPAIYVGSHLDSVQKGGRFDGVLGVVAGLEVVRYLVEEDIQPECSIIVVNFTNEEGARFEPSMMASGVIAGKFDKDKMLNTRDTSDITVQEALQDIGYVGLVENRMTHGKAFLELHIEQGPVLEAESLKIGAVECVVGMSCYEIEIRGESNHAGTTPQQMRRDALTAANRCMTALHEKLGKLDPTLVYTMGRFNVFPNIHTVIPNKVVFSLEARHQSAEILQKVEDIIHAIVSGMQGECGQSVKKLWSRETVWFDPDLVHRIEKAAQTLDLSFKRMVSGAGHDAQFISTMMPTAMIFVPSAGGKSHDEDEYTSWEECENGVNLLLETVLELSGSR
ncbi:Zn-dependent hydrolase [Alkalicoccobacillus gibsonii]|uniref:Zn-dependent hydrolase n=1 Tax=Alkalicoccobacillus gibsonii TaxID=79881 RepID=UPI001934365E|nr:Zn-dependent hydrolase [Alkalicoccobacillus gibsonii]MBM0065618.1 Zn-dependent hydrolase [Alkalicoccobacillus gibsonii]